MSTNPNPLPLRPLVNQYQQKVFLEFLAASGLTPEDVPLWCLCDKYMTNRLLRNGDRSKVKCDCIIIPYTDLDGKQILDRGVPFYRARLLDPEKKKDRNGKISTKKYASPPGSYTYLYIPLKLKATLEKMRVGEIPDRLLVITEGEKKAEALIKIGVPAVGIPGISMGAVRKDPEDKSSPRELLPAIKEVIEAYIEAVSDKGTPRILVLFDSDGNPGPKFPGSHALRNGKHVGNTAVFFEATFLAKKIWETKFSSGVAVAAGWCPRGPVDENGVPQKQGIDDWIEATKREGGSVDAIVTALEDMVAENSYSGTREQLTQGYKGLGYLGCDTLVIWSHPTQNIARIGANDLSKAATLMLLVGPEFAINRWPKYSKSGDVTIDTNAAAAAIIKECHAAGPWNESRERGGGVWCDGKPLVINAAEGFFLCTKYGLAELSNSDRFEFSLDYIYPACGRFSIGKVSVELEPGDQLARRLIQHLKLWGWTKDTAPYLIAGWICMQAYLGALDARPSVTLIGESGAGKSLLARHIGLILGGTAYRIEDGAGTTSAGLRQIIGKDAMTILLDEAEPGANQTQVAEQRAATLRRLLDMLRASFSASDGGNVRTTVKGSASGRAVDYSIRISAMINAINRPDFDQADRNRFLLAEITKKGRSAKEPPEDGLEDLGIQIRHNLWAHWDEFKAIYAHVLGMEDVGEARLRKTWGTPVAALMTLRYGEKWSENIPAIDEMMRAVAADQSSEDEGTDESDQAKAYRALLSAMIDCEMIEIRGSTSAVVTRKRSVFEVFCEAKKDSPHAPDNLAGKSLKRYGLARFDRANGPMLFVSDNPLLREALRGTPWATGGIVGVLARLEGAVVAKKTAGADNRVRINGSRQFGVFIPIPENVAEETIDLEALLGVPPDFEPGADVPF